MVEGGDLAAGQCGGGGSRGDGLRQTPFGRFPGDLGEQVPGEGGVTGADGRSGHDARGRCGEDPVGTDQDRARAAQRQQHGLDPAGPEPFGRGHRQVEVALVGVRVAADGLGELLGVRLEQVEPLPGLQERGERDAGRVDRDPDRVAVTGTDGSDQDGEGVVGQPRRQRPGDDDPAGARAGRGGVGRVRDEGGQVVEASGERGAGLVELRRGAGRAPSR